MVGVRSAVGDYYGVEAEYEEFLWCDICGSAYRRDGNDSHTKDSQGKIMCADCIKRLDWNVIADFKGWNKFSVLDKSHELEENW